MLKLQNAPSGWKLLPPALHTLHQSLLLLLRQCIISYRKSLSSFTLQSPRTLLQNDATRLDDLLQRANSTVLEAQLMSHDAGVTATKLYTHLHMLRRHTVLDTSSVDLPQRHKNRFLIMSVGGNDLFGPNAHKVQEWKIKLISRVFDKRESRDKATKIKPSSSVHPPRSLSQQSPLDAIHTPRSKDSYQRPPGQSFRRDFQKSSNRPKQSSSSKGQSYSKDRKPTSQQYCSSGVGQSGGQGSARKDKEKASQQSRSFYKKGRGSKGNQRKKDELASCGGEPASLPVTLDRTVPAVSGNSLKNLARHSDCLP